MKNRKLICLLLIIFLSSPVISQVIDSTNKAKPAGTNDTEDVIYQFVEEMADFPGGEKAMIDHLATHTVYPAIAREKMIEGTVYVQFIVEKDGTITNVEVKRSTAPELNEAALAAVRSMPRWNPGKQRGKAVRLMYVLPVKFQLDSGKKRK